MGNPPDSREAHRTTVAAPSNEAVRPTVGADPRQGLGLARTTPHVDVLATVEGPEPVMAASPFEDGNGVGHYEFIRLLGRGGMGSVYLARDTKLGRMVAIKVLRTRLGPGGADQDAVLLREARATARLQHENIVVIHEVGRWNEQPYMVLEHLDGRPLRGLIEGRQLRPRQAVEYIVPVVRALVCAHEHGIVHRDLKPENVLVTSTGLVKVLDFGIAQVLREAAPQPEPAFATEHQADAGAPTVAGPIVGTMLYMAPEQWRGGHVDGRADQWAVGLMLYELVAGRHPMSERSVDELSAVGRGDARIPPVSATVPSLPGDLQRIIKRCLAVDPEDRFPAATDLLDALHATLPDRFAPQLAGGASPYPGLSAFQEWDASRFFGRTRDIGRVTSLLERQPLVAVVGPSGVGKSSLVRAGVLPSLKVNASWDALVLRPGRHPLAALAAAAIGASTDGMGSGRRRQGIADLAGRLAEEPGHFGKLMRRGCAERSEQRLIFVDQFEELYTLAKSQQERTAFVACLLGAADDPSSPVRVIVSLRSDFLDRLGEHPELLASVTRGLAMLQAPRRQQLEEALVRPAEVCGYHFGDPTVVVEMLDALEGRQGALPLLQFAATQLWDQRQRDTRTLTRGAYDQTGGIVGLLAAHADEVLSGLPADSMDIQKAVFRRLVTSDGTRATADRLELEALGDPDRIGALLDRLVEARLLVVQQLGEQHASYELAHEALIEAWPRLRRWLDEGREHAGFVDQLVAAARQWDAKGRPSGLLWRGDTAQDAQHFRRHYRGPLAPRERAYLNAVLKLQRRQGRFRVGAVVGVLIFLAAVVAAGSVALVEISAAEGEAQTKARDAEEQRGLTESANAKLRLQIEAVQRKETQRSAAAKRADRAQGVAATRGKELATRGKELATTTSDLEASNRDLKAALTAAQEDKKTATVAKERAVKSASEARQAERRATAAKEKLQAQKKKLEKTTGELKVYTRKLEKRIGVIERGKLK